MLIIIKVSLGCCFGSLWLHLKAGVHGDLAIYLAIAT